MNQSTSITCRKGGKPLAPRYCYDVSEVARELNVSRRTIQRLLKRTKCAPGRVKLQRSASGSRCKRGLNYLAILEARNKKAGRASGHTSYGLAYIGGKFRPAWVRVAENMNRIAGAKWRDGIGVLMAACADRSGAMEKAVREFVAQCGNRNDADDQGLWNDQFEKCVAPYKRETMDADLLAFCVRNLRAGDQSFTAALCGIRNDGSAQAAVADVVRRKYGGEHAESITRGLTFRQCWRRLISGAMNCKIEIERLVVFEYGYDQIPKSARLESVPEWTKRDEFSSAIAGRKITHYFHSGRESVAGKSARTASVRRAEILLARLMSQFYPHTATRDERTKQTDKWEAMENLLITTAQNPSAENLRQLQAVLQTHGFPPDDARRLCEAFAEFRPKPWLNVAIDGVNDDEKRQGEDDFGGRADSFEYKELGGAEIQKQVKDGERSNSISRGDFYESFSRGELKMNRQIVARIFGLSRVR